MGLIACMLMPMIKNILQHDVTFEWVADQEIHIFCHIQICRNARMVFKFSFGAPDSENLPNPESTEYNLESLKLIVCCSEPCSLLDCLDGKKF